MKMAKKIILKDAFKGFTLDQDKIVSPEETIRILKNRLAGIDLDILSHTRRIDTGRLNIPVYFSVCGKDAAALCGTKKQMGKGATPEQAEASAVMELAERFSFFSFYNNSDNFIIEPHKNIQKTALPFEMIAKSVHDGSDEALQAQKIFEEIPLKWTWGFNLTKETPVLVPFDWFYAINEFNGTSAGNCVEEALCQGICEIVERHVCSIISQGRCRTPSIKPETASDQMVVDMLKKYENAGIRLFFSDFSLDMGIPTVGVLAYDPATFPEKSEIVWTAGTTPNPEKALSRALTETAQLAGDFNTASNYVASGLPKFSSIAEADFITRPEIERNISQLPDISNPNIKIEVENCLQALRNKNMDVIAVETTHPLLDIPAFYTIIPGSHFRERSLGTSVGMFSAKLITEHYPPGFAFNELKKIDRLLPGKYYVQFYMGLCQIALGKQKNALNDFDRALDLNPNIQDKASIYSYKGSCLKDLGRYKEALAVLEKGRLLDPERTDIHNLMGFCHYKLKNHENAIACFSDAIRINPNSAIDYANIASNYRDMGKKEKAIAYYQTALTLDPTIDFAKENLAKLMVDG
jgi:ribosomal protein S12 methylthiotransferase accessory factor